MLVQFDISKMLDDMNTFSSLKHHTADRAQMQRNLIMRPHDHSLTADQASSLRAECEKIGLFQAVSALDSFLLRWSEIPEGVSEDGQPCRALVPFVSLRIHAELEHVSKSISEGLREHGIFSVERGLFRQFYDPDTPLFGLDVVVAFPSSADEISEAGKCIALERWTAAVMHLMRALEPALLALQKAVDVDVPKENWDQVIRQIEAKIRQINKRDHGAEKEKWFSDAAAHFLVIKNAWRNYAQHNKERYDRSKCLDIYNSVRSFMRHLAEKISE